MASEPYGRARMLKVEVLYAQPDRVWRTQVEVPDGSTLADVVATSRLTEVFPELLGKLPPVGVYGRVCSPDQTVQAEDRVEVYRPLVYDPMESRRRRQHHRQRQAGKTLSDT